MNLDTTIAVTQNFVNVGNFERVWFRTRKGRKKLSVRFLEKLKEHKPEQYRIALEMNERDGFVMWDQREEYKHKFQKKEQRNKKPDASGRNNNEQIKKPVK